MAHSCLRALTGPTNICHLGLPWGGHGLPYAQPQPQPEVEEEAFEEELQLDAELIPLLDQTVEVVGKLIFIITSRII